jgi:hypothetical protein
MSNVDARQIATPDGIGEEHIRPMEDWRRHASPLSLAVFGVVILAGMTGLLGHERDWRAESGGRSLAVHAPEITRNGEFLEMRVRVESEEPIDELGIGVEGALWEDMTVNTMIPAPTEELAEDGEFRFAFGPLEAGTAFDLKIDLQVNPDIVGGNQGAVTLYDGDMRLTAVEISMAVLP